MRRATRALLLVLLLLAGAGGAWAGIIGTSDPNLPTWEDSIDWCVNFGCSGKWFGSPQFWTSANGATGTVGTDNGEDFLNLQQGNGWLGGVPSGMGLIYNGGYDEGSLGNTPGNIAVSFQNTADLPYISYTPVNGVGAYIISDWFGPFTATLTLYDASFNPLGTVTGTGNSTPYPGVALFIGAYDNTWSYNVYSALFTATGTGFHEPDFAIGATELMLTPEPASIALIGIGLGLLGVGFKLRRRAQKA